MRGGSQQTPPMLESVIPPPVPVSSGTQPWGQPPASERLRVAWQQRHESDYIFNFATAFGWLLLTCGIYGYYILYQLMRRSRDHNRRRLDLLDAATSFAWEQAQAQGVSEALRPDFQRISDRMRELNEVASEFRDPALWVVLSVVSSGLAQYVGWIFIDGDLVKHDEAERAIETDLASIYARLGQQIEPPDPTRTKAGHNVVGRIVATLASLGFYSIWWMRDLMVEGNAHLEQNWRFEDDLARASQALMAA
jgi:hypothetical protein